MSLRRGFIHYREHLNYKGAENVTLSLVADVHSIYTLVFVVVGLTLKWRIHRNICYRWYLEFSVLHFISIPDD